MDNAEEGKLNVQQISFRAFSTGTLLCFRKHLRQGEVVVTKSGEFRYGTERDR